MLIMILELLAVGFLVGMFITAVVLGVISAADVLVRAKHANAAGGATVGSFGPRSVGALQPHRAHAGAGQRRAA